MYDSGVTANELINGIIDEADVELPIPTETWVLWLNELEYMLYSEIIKEQKKADIKPNENGTIILADIEIDKEKQNKIKAEDVCHLYADRTQLMKSTAASGDIFPDTWYIEGEDIRYNTVYPPEYLVLIYNVRPAMKYIEDNEVKGGNVRVPYGFLDMVRSRLRGEAYKLANEDNHAAKWLSDYNVLLENFKVYVKGRQAEFGG